MGERKEEKTFRVRTNERGRPKLAYAQVRKNFGSPGISAPYSLSALQTQRQRHLNLHSKLPSVHLNLIYLRFCCAISKSSRFQITLRCENLETLQISGRGISVSPLFRDYLQDEIGVESVKGAGTTRFWRK